MKNFHCTFLFSLNKNKNYTGVFKKKTNKTYKTQTQQLKLQWNTNSKNKICKIKLWQIVISWFVSMI